MEVRKTWVATRSHYEYDLYMNDSLVDAALEQLPHSKSAAFKTGFYSIDISVGGVLMSHSLAPLAYDYAALEPYIDAQTMQLHHDKHHAAYVNNLNTALAQYPNLQGETVEALLTHLNEVPETIRAVVRNNAGGHFNHTLFWQSMSPNGGGSPTGDLAKAMVDRFGSFDAFQQQFVETGLKLFGSGWVWLVVDPDHSLQIVTTPNQDSPITTELMPLLGNDVWEHAYYLKYQNQRLDYLKAWWNVVNWTEIDRRFAAIGSQPVLSSIRG